MNENWFLAAAAGFVVSVVVYSIQKWRDRIDQIRARHFDVYVEMVEAIGAMGIANQTGTGKKEALSEYFAAKLKFSVVASDNVMRKFVAFDRLISSGDQLPHGAFDRALAEFMLVVRIENLGPTGISGDDLVILTPYGKSLR